MSFQQWIAVHIHVSDDKFCCSLHKLPILECDSLCRGVAHLSSFLFFIFVFYTNYFLFISCGCYHHSITVSSHPEITVIVGLALKINYLSIYPHLSSQWSASSYTHTFIYIYIYQTVEGPFRHICLFWKQVKTNLILSVSVFYLWFSVLEYWQSIDVAYIL